MYLFCYYYHCVEFAYLCCPDTPFIQFSSQTFILFHILTLQQNTFDQFDQYNYTKTFSKALANTIYKTETHARSYLANNNITCKTKVGIPSMRSYLVIL
jgi:hypothetical protein